MRKITYLFSTMTLLFMLFGCGDIEVKNESFQNDFVMQLLSLSSEKAISVNQDIAVAAGGRTTTQSLFYEIGSEPLYVYIEDGWDSFIIFEDDNHDYQISNLYGAYDSDELYGSYKADPSLLDELGLMSEEMVDYGEFTNLDFELILDHVYQANLGFDELLNIELFEDYGELIAGDDAEILRDIMLGETTIEIDLNEGIEISIEVDFLYHEYDTDMNVKIKTKMIGNEDPIKVHNINKFVCMDNTMVENPKTISVDEVVRIPRYPDRVYPDFYCKIYLEEGDYLFERDNDVRMEGMYDSSDFENRLSVYGVFGIDSGIHISKSGYYYCKLTLWDRTAPRQFSFVVNPNPDHETREPIDISNMTSFEYNLSDYNDYELFEIDDSAWAYTIMLTGLNDETEVLISRNGHSPASGLHGDINEIMYNEETYYCFVMHYYDKLFIRNLSEDDNIGIMRIEKNIVYDIHNYEGEYPELTSSFEIYGTYDMDQRIHMNVEEEGTYLFEINFPYFVGNPHLVVYYFDEGGANIINLFLDEDNMSQLVTLESREYWLYINGQFPFVLFEVRYTKVE